jgi:hypothetical protein
MLTKIASFEICESNQYSDCQIYMICTSNFNCEYLKICANHYIEKLPKFITTLFMNEDGVKEMTVVLMKFCLSSEMSKSCAKYQIFSKGEIPPINLLPDGRKISPFDLLFKRKITVNSQR